ncbi:MAG TPA: citrate/2-methylcitrate synthase [Candidatus Dormibacteraeota bacterium]|nr:citrate/2-methylcitrate synthase [Candidatus Dormibacteraeota bacterium]
MVGSLLSAQEAAERLGVKPATLYAYVSRGLVRRERGADGRSLFALTDVDRLGRRGRRDRASGTELRIESALTAIEDHAIFYRGEDVLVLAQSRTFEEVAEFLWTGEFHERRPWVGDPRAQVAAASVQAALPVAALPLDRLRVAVPALAALDPLRYDTGEAAVVVTGRRLIAAMAGALPGGGGSAPLRVRQAVSDSIAGRLWNGLGSGPPRDGAVETLNAALVLVADHELSVSTVAARMAASIAADPYAVVSVGLSALGGAMQAVASLAVEDLLGEVSSPELAARAIGERLRRGDRLPGFGHRLYPGGDPRAPALLRLLRRSWRGDARLDAIEAVIAACAERGLPAPNIDFMLASLAHLAGMQRGASEAIFAVARTAGWLAHAIEEYERRTSIRPRAIYVGVPVGPER